MKRKTHVNYFALIFCCFSLTTITSQNLLNSWELGSGSAPGYQRVGTDAENIRVYGENHLGQNVILWKGGNDAINGGDGGWKSSYVPIDNAKKYRFSVWIKKTNSNDGNTYFGCQHWQYNQSSGAYNILNLSGNLNWNPYFWYGDLPRLDRWYLLVGYIHEKNTTVTTNQGAIYDGVTGKFIQNITDFKFDTSTNILRHRAFLYYDPNINDRQYHYAPRIEEVNSATPTIAQLLGINENSTLKFTYDTPGNQAKREYCSGSCTSRVSTEIQAKEEVAEESIENIEDAFRGLNIFPNPTQSNITIKTSQESLVKRITVFDIKGALLQTLDYNKPVPSMQVNLSRWPVGVYYLHLHLENGESTTKKVIKQ